MKDKISSQQSLANHLFLNAVSKGIMASHFLSAIHLVEKYIRESTVASLCAYIDKCDKSVVGINKKKK